MRTGSDALPEEITRILMLSSMTYGGRCQLEDAILAWVRLQRAEARAEALEEAAKQCEGLGYSSMYPFDTITITQAAKEIRELEALPQDQGEPP